MKQSFLKTNVTDSTIVVDENGEILSKDVKTFKYLANTQESFYLCYASLISIMQYMSNAETRLYAYLLENYKSNSEIGITRQIRLNIGKKLDLNERTVANTLSSLVAKKLLYSTQQSIYKLNPRYAFQGSTSDRNRLLKVILELECPDC